MESLVEQLNEYTKHGVPRLNDIQLPFVGERDVDEEGEFRFLKPQIYSYMYSYINECLVKSLFNEFLKPRLRGPPTYLQKMERKKKQCIFQF